MITLIYPFRNRSIDRIKKSLDSLSKQSNNEFEIQFIDYGSELNLANNVKKIVESYSFCNYLYTYSINQPWNKSRALNIVIKDLESDYCFVSDVDMIYHPDFISRLHQVKNKNTVTYFQVGFLSDIESKKNVSFEDYKTKFLTTNEATGLSLFPVKKLKEVNGFDEFFHFWGAEDTDMHLRLKNHGLLIEYYDKEVLIKHQWHESYLSNRKKKLGIKLVLNGIENYNHYHKDQNNKLKTTKVNLDFWGKLITKDEYYTLNNLPIKFKLTNKKSDLNYLVNSMLKSKKNKPLSVQINKTKLNMIQKIKSLLLANHYSMEEINNTILKTIIKDFRNKNYIYKVSEDANTIILKIEL